MKPTLLHRGFCMAVTVGALALAPAHAALLPVDTEPGLLDVSPAWALTGAERAPAVTAPATKTALLAPLDDERAHILALKPSGWPAGAGASLWTFVTSIRAQQQGDRFVILETHTSLLQLAEAPPAPVPLPGALWFLVMGLLGLAGVRITGRGGERQRTAPATLHGAALPQAI